MALLFLLAGAAGTLLAGMAVLLPSVRGVEERIGSGARNVT